MSDFDFVITGATKFVPFSGAGSEVFPYDGASPFRVTFAPGPASTNKLIAITHTSLSPNSAGMKIVKYQPVTGVRKDGVPNTQGLLELIWSALTSTMTAEQAQAAIAQYEGKSFNCAALNQLFANQVVYAKHEVERSESKGKTYWGSTIKTYIPKAEYDSGGAGNERAVGAEVLRAVADWRARGGSNADEAPAATGPSMLGQGLPGGLTAGLPGLPQVGAGQFAAPTLPSMPGATNGLTAPGLPGLPGLPGVAKTTL